MLCAIRRIIADRLFRCFIAPTLKVLCIERVISGDTIAVTYHAHAPKKPYAARRPGAVDKGDWGVSDGLPPLRKHTIGDVSSDPFFVLLRCSLHQWRSRAVLLLPFGGK